MSWEEENESSTPFKRDNSYCHVCGKHGKVSLDIFLYEDANKLPMFLCSSVVCVDCNNKKGRWVTMYTGRPKYPDYRCRDTKLPQGLTWDMVQRTLMKHPLRRSFHITDFKIGTLL